VRPARGFLIIETLVALLVLSLGVLGMTTLMGHATGAAGDAKARSQALALARGKLDELRNTALPADYASRLATGTYGPEARSVDGITYERRWRVTAPYAAWQHRKVDVWVDWTDRLGRTQRVQLDSAVAWSDPVRSAMGQAGPSAPPVRPGGGAIRGTGTYTPGAPVRLVDGAAAADKTTRLLDANGASILYLPADRFGNPLRFTTISGRVYFDTGASNMPAPEGVNVRMSSEGQCVFDNRSASLGTVPAGAVGTNIRYRFFRYTCYVGTGWYGNIGLQLPATQSTASVCVGDPGYTDTGRTTDPVALPSQLRSYRSFMRMSDSGPPTYLTTGMAPSTPSIAYQYGDDEDPATVTNGGAPRPRSLGGPYAGLSDVDNFLRQDFLVTRVGGNVTCAQRMLLEPGTFTRNAGRAMCIAPDNSSGSLGNLCPDRWPGF